MVVVMMPRQPAVVRAIVSRPFPHHAHLNWVAPAPPSHRKRRERGHARGALPAVEAAGAHRVVGNERQHGAERAPHALGVEPVAAPFALQRQLGVRAICRGREAHARAPPWPPGVSAAAPPTAWPPGPPSHRRRSSSTCPPCSWYAPAAPSPWPPPRTAPRQRAAATGVVRPRRAARTAFQVRAWRLYGGSGGTPPTSTELEVDSTVVSAMVCTPSGPLGAGRGLPAPCAGLFQLQSNCLRRRGARALPARRKAAAQRARASSCVACVVLRTPSAVRPERARPPRCVLRWAPSAAAVAVRRGAPLGLPARALRASPATTPLTALKAASCVRAPASAGTVCAWRRRPRGGGVLRLVRGPSPCFAACAVVRAPATSSARNVASGGGGGVGGVAVHVLLCSCASSSPPALPPLLLLLLLLLLFLVFFVVLLLFVVLLPCSFADEPMLGCTTG